MKKLSILALALSILAASCTKEVGEMGSGRAKAGEIRVSAMVNGITKATTDGADTTFENGDKLSLYVWTGDNKAVPDVRWIDGEVNTFNAETGKWEPKDMMLWKNTAHAHYFLGVYPARTITNFTADPFTMNLDPAAKNEVNDLLVATILGDGVKASVAPVPLVMDHLMAKLKVTLTLRNQWSGDPEVHVYVKAAYTGTVDYLSKTITPGNDVTTFGFDGLGEGFQTTLIIPQEGVTEITVTVDGTKYVYTHPTSIPLTRGHVTTLPLVVGKDVIELDGNVTVEGWTAGELPEGLGGDAVVAPKVTDLATIKENHIASDGETLSGTLDVEHYPVKISIADGATVTLDGVSILGVNDENCKWAGITCEGDATIILKEGSVNSVMGFYQTAPGIFIPEGKTLVIKGDGSLTASTYIADPNDFYSYGYGAGIGGGQGVSCGNIEIQGGNITAIGGRWAAGIGCGSNNEVGSNCGTIKISGGTVVATSRVEMGAGIGCGYSGICDSITISGGTVEATGGYGGPGIGSTVGASSCGDITISGGTVTATTSSSSPGIGSSIEPSVCGNITISGGTVTAIGKGYSPGIGAGGSWFKGEGGSCGNITITSGVTKVTAIKGTEPEATNSIGAGFNAISCGTVTIGDMVTGSIPTSPYMYPIDLSKVTANVVAGNGARIFETLAGNYKVSIDDGATVILDNASISYSSNGADWAGLTLIGDGTIQLADGTTNNAIGGLDSQGLSNWPGIFVPEGKTLTINGNTGVLNAARGTLAKDDGSPAGIGASWGANAGDIVINGGVINVTGGNKGAGIGGCGRRGCGDITINAGTVTAIGGMYASGIGLGGTNNSSYADSGTCGDITIAGGTVNATGGDSGAGIGTGSAIDNNTVAVTKICGNILISGGTVSATGGKNAAGIGSGEAKNNGNITVGTITITDGVTLVTATKGADAPNSIGKGSGTNVTCGTVTIGGVVGAISDSPYVYPLPYPINLSEVTSGYVGSVIASNGMVYATASKAADAGTTAVAIITYVGSVGSVDASSETYKGLALALADANGGNKAAWSSVDANCLDKQYGYGDDPTVDMSGIANTNILVSDGHDHDAASAARNYNGGTHPAGTSEWFLPSAGQWQKMITAAGSYATLVSNVNLKSTTDPYWSSTEYGNGRAWTYAYGSWDYYGGTSFYVRACLAF